MADSGDVIGGRYRLVGKVGTGAMGVVWQAEDQLLNRSVAVKELLVYVGMTEAQTREAHRRAMREGRIAARLQHVNAISVYDVVEHEGRPCLIMEFLPSRSLSDLTGDGVVLPPEQATRIGGQIAAALAAAHDAGIVHRDVKPDNVLLSEDGTAKLTDFGISHAVGDSRVTATGILAGTPAFLAPEIARGQEAHWTSDVYSLGATLYAAVEGVPPFGYDDNAIALLHRVATEEISPPQQAGELGPVLARMLERDPERRPTAREAAKLLNAIAVSSPAINRTRPAAAPVATAAPAAELAAPADSPAAEAAPAAAVPAPADAPARDAPAAGAAASGAAASGAAVSGAAPEEEFSFPAPRPATPSIFLTPEPEPDAPGEPVAAQESGVPLTPSRQVPAPPPEGERKPGWAAAPASLRAHRRRRLIIVGGLVVVVLLVVGTLVTFMLTSNDDNTKPPLAAPLVTSSHAAATTHSAVAAPTTTLAPRTTATTANRTTTNSPVAPTTANPPAGSSAGDPVSFITGYYAMMPGNTDAGWNDMTADYQQNHAGGRSGYDNFWAQFSAVSLSDVAATGSAGVVADINYTYKNGSHTTEHTTFGLVQQDGQWKIASSTVG
ncbi:MAG TPA: serine/threonine-protein kinase [Pseudonocardiaceae bacterium]|nr:serine/threonine-protein kinase [Pseudonocardiaceae bacterium]